MNRSVRLFFVFDEEELDADTADAQARNQMEQALGAKYITYDVKGAYPSREVSRLPDPEYDVDIDITTDAVEALGTSDPRPAVLRAFNQTHGTSHDLDHVEPTD